MEKREMSILKGIRNGLCFFLMAGTVACNGETGTVEDNVTDEAAVAETKDKEEFHRAFASTSHYENWDLNNDNFLDEEEFRVSFYQTWDLDNDGRISQGEWTTVVSDYSNHIDATDWRAWDTDGDGFIDRVEFDANFAEMGWYTGWDTNGDGQVDLREYTDGAFAIWDENDDNVLDETEFIRYSTYYRI